MSTDWNQIRIKKEELFEQIPQDIKDQFNEVPGIYGIYIQGHLAYVGKSKNLLGRWIAHKINTLFNYGQHDYREDKYMIFREAYNKGYSIECKPIELCSEHEISSRERYWINKEQPILNGGFNSMVHWKGTQFLESLDNAS